MSSSNAGFQKILYNTYKDNSDRNWYEDFFDKFIALFKALGFNFDKNTVLATAIDDILFIVKQEPIVEEVEVTEPVVQDKKYELFPGVYANAGQREALDKLRDFLNSKEQVFTLVGRGGTGKTTIIKKILADAKGQVGGITVSHKAKKVLGKSIGGEKVKTIASALAIKLDETTGEFLPDEFARSQGKVPIRRMNLIIVDEASMVSQDMYDEIMSMKQPGVKVIFMGDNAQLPPIGDDKESPVFNAKDKYTLVEKMRQAKGSPIINIGTIVADNVEATTPKVVAIEKSKRVNKYDKVSNSSVKFTSNQSAALDELAEDFRKANGNPDFVKAITFNNERHSAAQSVKNLNAEIRHKLYGEKAKEQFLEGELVTAYDTYSRDAGQDSDEVPVHNADDFIIKSIESQKNVSKTISVFSMKGGTRTFNYSYDLLQLELKDSEGKTIPGSTVPVIADSSKSKYESDLAQLWKTDKQLAFALKGEFANIQYGYAITSHKAQGSTYTNVYVFEDNILGPTNGSNTKAKNQSLYVAVSRPTTKLVMISNRNTDSKEVQTLEDTTGGEVIESLSPATNIPTVKQIRTEIKEINDDGVTKHYPMNQVVFNRLYNRLADINKKYPWYKATVEKMSGEGVNSKKLFYYIHFELKKFDNFVDRISLISDKEVQERIKYCKGR
jgi:exodeoxyribonuclease-5